MTQENLTQTIPGDLSDYEIIDPPFTVRRVLTAEQIGALMSSLSPNRVSTRQQAGATLSYVEAWDVKATLIRIFGFGGFSSEVIESSIIDIRDDGRQGQKQDGTNKTPYVMAYARVRLTIHNIGPSGQDVHYTEAAIGSSDGWTISDVADNALKNAASDALKRCAIFLGTQLGLSLYNAGSKQDVVRLLLDPEQKELLAQWRAEQEEKRNKAADEQVNKALGGERVTKDPLIAEEMGTAEVAP